MTFKPDTQRAEHLNDLLEKYCPKSSPEENLVDILADAMHWCYLYGLSFASLLITAQMHVEIEADVSGGQSRPPPVNGSEPEVRVPIGLRPLGQKLLTLSNQMAEFAQAHDAWLSLQDYLQLNKQQAALKALAQLTGAFNQDAYLSNLIRQAQEYLDWMRARATVQAN